MHEQINELHDRVGRLDGSVERLTSEVTSLKLELASLISTLRENDFQSAPRVTAAKLPLDPPSRPSITPAAIVVLLATGFLSWQLITMPHPDRSIARAMQPAPIPRAADQKRTPPPQIELAATEPPVTPLVHPTIYKGTLSVNADRPGAQVFINRQMVGTAPVRIRNLRAGAHLVWVERDGFRRWTRVVTVPAERVTRVSADLEPAPFEP